LTSHRLALVAMLIAVKFNEDVFYTNKHYAQVGGVTTRELNLLEREFLQMLDWKVTIDKEEYDLYHGMVRQAVTGVAPKIEHRAGNVERYSSNLC